MTDTDNKAGPDNDSESTQAKPDWARIATDALDLWQSHLTSLANDPKAKEEMTRFVAPMGQMFSQWTSMMQQGMQTVAAATAQAAAAAQEAAAKAQAEAPAWETGDAADIVSADASEDQDKTEAAEGEGKKSGPDKSEAPDDGDASETIGAAESGLAESRPVTAEGPDDNATASQAAATGTRGRAASSDSARDLAQLAGRLAELERELDGLRARPRRGRDGGADPHSADGRDAADAGDVQQVAGTHSGKTSA